MVTVQRRLPDSQRRGQDFAGDEAAEIASLARGSGWQTAAHDYMRSVDNHAYRLAVDEYGAGLASLLPLTPTSRVLVLKCGWGAVALNLAGTVGSVVALDDRPTRLAFAEARRRQRGTANLRLLQIDLSRDLPFAPGAFDAVILLEALEQAGAPDGRDGKAAQQRLLESVRGLLAPGGSLLLGAANRLGFARPSLPGDRPLTYWGYRRVLAAAGFGGISFYTALPSQREPFFILPLDRWRLLNHFVDGIFTAQDYRAKLAARGLASAYQLAWAAWRLGRRLRLAGLARYVVPSYLVLARS